MLSFCCCDLQNKKCHDRHVFRINSSVFISASFIYKNGTCIYSLNQVRNKFSINEKEVYI